MDEPFRSMPVYLRSTDAKCERLSAGKVASALKPTGQPFPCLAHAPMERLNCTVQLSERRAELWVGTQFPGIDSAAAARVLGLKPEQVMVHVQMAGGGFGPACVEQQRLRGRGLRDRQGCSCRRPERAGAHDGIDAPAAEGMRDPYPLPMRLTVHHPKLNVPVLWWRSVGSTHTAFVMETLIDEIARPRIAT